MKKRKEVTSSLKGVIALYDNNFAKAITLPDVKFIERAERLLSRLESTPEAIKTEEIEL